MRRSLMVSVSLLPLLAAASVASAQAELAPDTPPPAATDPPPADANSPPAGDPNAPPAGDPNAPPAGDPNIQLTAPGLTPVRPPPFAPPSATRAIWEMNCDEDPNMALRNDCDEPSFVSSHTVVRGGFGHYFHPSGG